MSFKILVVDDDLQVLRFVKTTLESLGYEVLALSDSQEANRRIGHEKFNGVFLDVHIPKVDGIELARALRASPSNSAVPIVLLTGYDDVETMRAGFKAGVTFFQPKPVDADKLAGLLRHMHQAMLREKRSYVRLPLRTIVACTLGKYTFKSVSLNISEGGMMLEGTGGAAVGRELELRFSIPGVAEILYLGAVVTRLDPRDRMAVRFTRLEPKEQRVIQAYIAGVVKE